MVPESTCVELEPREAGLQALHKRRAQRRVRLSPCRGTVHESEPRVVVLQDAQNVVAELRH